MHIEFADGKPWIWRAPMLAPQITRRHIEQGVKGFRGQRMYVGEE